VTTARSLTFVGPHRVELRPIEVEPADGSLLIRTTWSGISGGTELLAFRAEIDPQTPLDESIGALGGTFRHPFRYGYSCVGEVERGAAGIAAGSTVLAFHPHQDLLVADPSDVVALGDLEPRLGTLFPLVETALQIALDAGPAAEEDVLVVGLGAVGLLTSSVLQRQGARVLGVEPSGFRREVARDAGVEAVAPEDASDAVRDRTDGLGAPLAVEASGRPEAPAAALPLLAHEGTLLVASWYGTKEVSLPLGADFHRRRLTIRSTQVSSIPRASRWTKDRRRAETLRLLPELPLKRLATHEFAFEDAQQAYEALDRGTEGLLHAALRYQ
jgi:2-desacetyl-2-hydroxyethyl bacteriochlorophyllide A dehydrogenase